MFSANTSQVSADQVYVEDVFSTYLYTGTPAYAQTIVNGIDLAGKGGLLWIKSRTSDTAPDHYLNFNDGSNIVSNQSNNTSARQVMSPYVAFNSNGFYVNAAPGFLNNNGVNYTSWTFRKAPKFFDIVTYTGNGSTARAISHSLGVAPGSMIIKRTDSSGQWVVYHRSLGNSLGLILESTIAQFNTNTFGYTTPDATTFTVGDYNNINGATYVAYLFAHDTTSDGIIQCGSFTTDGSSNASVTLGWEPQWVLTKPTSTTGNWVISDTMRGYSQTATQWLYPNTSDAEGGAGPIGGVNATGFKFDGIYAAGTTVAYIAIRRGPMRTPTSGTSVYGTVLSSGTNTTGVNLQPGILSDLMISRSVGTGSAGAYDRLRGVAELITRVTSGEGARGPTWAAMNGVITGSDGNQTYNNPAVAGTNFARWFFRRAPSFFDEVCYTGTGSLQTVNHNLTVAPELVIIKRRDGASDWFVLYAAGSGQLTYLNLNISAIGGSPQSYFSTNGSTYTPPSATSLFLTSNFSAGTYVAYLFASCPGVSKVGSYTGNGSSQTINCGFAAGARFILIKRTDSTGNWVVFDSARGIVSGNDPSLLLNSTDAETNYDDIDPDSSGFIVNQSTNNLNVSSGQYIYLAIS